MIDTHCHLSDSKYDGEVDNIVNNFLSAGLDFVVTIGCDRTTNERSKEIVNNYDHVYYTIGIHPDDCDTYDEAEIESYLTVNDPKLVAVGEIGLDYYHNKENKDKQKSVFISQILLAKKYHLPIVIHCRDAYGDMLEILKNYAPFENGAVMHCYSGSLEFAREILRLGIKISFTGNVPYYTFDKISYSSDKKGVFVDKKVNGNFLELKYIPNETGIHKITISVGQFQKLTFETTASYISVYGYDLNKVFGEDKYYSAVFKEISNSVSSCSTVWLWSCSSSSSVSTYGSQYSSYFSLYSLSNIFNPESFLI